VKFNVSQEVLAWLYSAYTCRRCRSYEVLQNSISRPSSS